MDFAGVIDTDKPLRISATQWHKLKGQRDRDKGKRFNFKNIPVDRFFFFKLS